MQRDAVFQGTKQRKEEVSEPLVLLSWLSLLLHVHMKKTVHWHHICHSFLVHKQFFPSIIVQSVPIHFSASTGLTCLLNENL